MTLTCDPDGGSHPRPIEACSQLWSVNGDPAKLNVSPNATCIPEYDPLTAKITGTLRGRQVAKYWTGSDWSSRPDGSTSTPSPRPNYA
ncbi:SSI family serine proteinase inhibitor [Kitasatospora sp. NPDC057936]|uniref:SSI family serine proteinase inhibitor n=1 Tax=Kitasatospora sp. NPDC057936 TaxID=3346283 RepID=UPI0036DB9E53